MTEDQIKHMVHRFLGWRLPTNFTPDDGISFDPISNPGRSFERRREPTGTNLFDANQTDAMVRYMVEGIPTAPLRPSHEIVSQNMERWIEWSRRDDAFNLFVPSDIRLMLGEIQRLRAEFNKSTLLARK